MEFSVRGCCTLNTHGCFVLLDVSELYTRRRFFSLSHLSFSFVSISLFPLESGFIWFEERAAAVSLEQKGTSARLLVCV